MPSIQPADPAARRRALLVLGVIAALGVAGYFALEAWLADVRLREVAEARRALPAALRWTAVAAGGGAAAFGIYAWTLGAKVARAQRFPPPGQPTVRDTRVLEGAAARRRGRIIQAIGLVLAVLGVALVLLVFFVAGRLASAVG